jgi:hypothetical protein
MVSMLGGMVVLPGSEGDGGCLGGHVTTHPPGGLCHQRIVGSLIHTSVLYRLMLSMMTLVV